MKILIFGGDGYIGSAFKHYMTLRNIEFSQLSSQKFQTSMELENAIYDHRPITAIINCSAYVGKNSIEDCETNKSATICSNVLFVQMLSDICLKKGITLCHMSSGCIYTGYPNGGYLESDEPNMTFENNNCSFYTGTKVVAEQLLRKLEKKYIWRIRLPFDGINHRRNYLTKILSYNKLVSIPNSLSNRHELVNACLDCICKEVPYGTYHMTNPGHISAKQIVDKIHKILKVENLLINKKFEYFEGNEFDKISKIPRSNTFLNTDKLKSAGIKMLDVNESIEKSLIEWKW